MESRERLCGLRLGLGKHFVCVGRAVFDRNCISLHDWLPQGRVGAKLHILSLHGKKEV